MSQKITQLSTTTIQSGDYTVLARGASNYKLDILAALGKPSWSNQGMAANTTASDNDEACTTAISSTPIGRVTVTVNGRQVSIGDGVKTKDGYFSGNTGTTARAYVDIAAGDKFYWVGSVAGYQLDSTTDTISFNYNA